MRRNPRGGGLGALIREPDPQPQQQQQQPQAPAPAFVPVGSGAAAATAPALSHPPTTQAQATVPAATPASPQSDGLFHVDIDLIDPSPYQPRTRFREGALEELARSILSSGIVQPLVVRRINNRYQLIAGERRWRAAQRAAIQRVPVVVRDVPEEMAFGGTLVKTFQREDVNR